MAGGEHVDGGSSTVELRRNRGSERELLRPHNWSNTLG
jgi:hypothetical protein